MKFSKEINLVELITLFVVIAGGFGSYFLVSSKIAALHQIQADVLEAKKEGEIIQAKVETANSLSDLYNSLSPKLKLIPSSEFYETGCDFILPDKKLLCSFYFTLENYGSYKASAKMVEVNIVPFSLLGASEGALRALEAQRMETIEIKTYAADGYDIEYFTEQVEVLPSNPRAFQIDFTWDYQNVKSIPVFDIIIKVETDQRMVEFARAQLKGSGIDIPYAGLQDVINQNFTLNVTFDADGYAILPNFSSGPMREEWLLVDEEKIFKHIEKE